jgi:CRP-like cAMP-binding protein
VSSAKTSLDPYVVETLMRDLVGHDRSSASFLVYVYLWHRARGSERGRVTISHQEMAEETGLSRRGVQGAVRRLQRRGLISSSREYATAVPEYRVHRPWIRRQKTRRAATTTR